MVHFDEDGQQGPHRLQPGDHVQLVGSMYDVVDVHNTVDSQKVLLNRPFTIEGPYPPEFVKTAHVWVMLEMRAPSMNVDHQLLVRRKGITGR